MHDRREPSDEREHAVLTSAVQPSAAPESALAVSTDESDEWLVSETYSDTDVSIRPRMHPHLSFRSGPELPGYGDDPIAMRAHQAIDAAVAEFIGYSERASLAPAAAPRHTPVGLPPQRELPEAPRPRRPTPVSSEPATSQPSAARRSTPPMPPLTARFRPTPSEPQTAARRSTPPSAATGQHPAIAHIETTPHGILPRTTPVDTRPAQPYQARRSSPPPLPPSAATGRHPPVAAEPRSQPFAILPASTQPELRPYPQAPRHAARRPTPAHSLPPVPPLPAAPSPRRNTPMPMPIGAVHRAAVGPHETAGETQPLPSASPRQTPFEPLPGATVSQGVPEQFQEQLLRALQRAHDSDVRSVAAERRAILAESAARAAAISANVTQPSAQPPVRGRAGRALLWGAVCFSLGGYMALLVPIRERMLEQAQALHELSHRQAQALEAQRQYYSGEQQRLERHNAELERQLQTSAEAAAKLTAAANTRTR